MASSRRMFSLAIVDSDAFLDLPAKAQLLYFHLGMRADDEGLIDNVRKILTITRIGEGELRTLMDAGYVISFGTGVYAVRHWKSNNLIQKDRFRPSSHRKEREMLEIDRGGCYSIRPDCLDSVSSAVSSTASNDVSRDNAESGMEKKPIKLDGSGETVFELLPLLKGGKAAVTESYVERLESLYPAVDVRSEVRKAVAWLEANPRNRKTQWKRFLNSWLARAQDGAARTDEARPHTRLRAAGTVHSDRIDSGRYGDVDVMDFSDPSFDYEGYCERNGIREDKDD